MAMTKDGSYTYVADDLQCLHVVKFTPETLARGKETPPSVKVIARHMYPQRITGLKIGDSEDYLYLTSDLNDGVEFSSF